MIFGFPDFIKNPIIPFFCVIDQINVLATIVISSYFKSFSASSCDFFIYAFTNTKDWREFLEIKEDVLYQTSKIISENNAAIAFPTTTIDWTQN